MDLLREKLRRAAGLFVELPPEPKQSDEEEGSVEEPPRAMTVEQLVQESEGPNLDEISVSASGELPVVTGDDGQVDFGAIYAKAGLPSTPFTAEQAMEMLTALPAELPLTMRRQTVTVTLNAMGRSIGATPETIVADASRKLAALTAYTDNLSSQTAETVATAEQEIRDLEHRIEAKRQETAAAQQKLAGALKVCHAESDRLDDVLEFFSLDVAPSKHSPAGQESQGRRGA